MTVCFVAAHILLGTMLPGVSSVSRLYNAPPAAGLMKDLFVVWLFAWAIAANTFNAVAALEHLVGKRQFVTARDCLRWNALFEARMPIRCFPFPWKWGAAGIAVLVLILIGWELNYYASLHAATSAAYWITFLGLGRNLVLIGAIVETMVFYKMALVEIRSALS